MNYYSVYPKRGDTPIITRGTSLQCARKIGITRRSFYTYVRRGCSKWRIVKVQEGLYG